VQSRRNNFLFNKVAALAGRLPGVKLTYNRKERDLAQTIFIPNRLYERSLSQRKK